MNPHRRSCTSVPWGRMPRIWADTIDGHRRQVHDAVLDATAQLIAEQGPLSVAMSAIAERAGIGRATLYKYFPDVETILVAWHTRDVAGHLHRLTALVEADDVTLDDVAEFVRTLRRHHLHGDGAGVIATFAHALADADDAHGAAIEREVLTRFTDLFRQLAGRGEVRDDHDPEVLARWLVHAVHAPAGLDDDAAAGLVADSLAPAARRRP